MGDVGGGDGWGVEPLHDAGDMGSGHGGAGEGGVTSVEVGAVHVYTGGDVVNRGCAVVGAGGGIVVIGEVATHAGDGEGAASADTTRMVVGGAAIVVAGGHGDAATAEGKGFDVAVIGGSGGTTGAVIATEAEVYNITVGIVGAYVVKSCDDGGGRTATCTSKYTDGDNGGIGGYADYANVVVFGGGGARDVGAVAVAILGGASDKGGWHAGICNDVKIRVVLVDAGVHDPDPASVIGLSGAAYVGDAAGDGLGAVGGSVDALNLVLGDALHAVVLDGGKGGVFADAFKAGLVEFEGYACAEGCKTLKDLLFFDVVLGKPGVDLGGDLGFEGLHFLAFVVAVADAGLVKGLDGGCDGMFVKHEDVLVGDDGTGLALGEGLFDGWILGGVGAVLLTGKHEGSTQGDGPEPVEDGISSHFSFVLNPEKSVSKSFDGWEPPG